MSFALSPCSPMAIPETKSISSASITLSSAGRLVLGQDAFQAGIRHLDRGHCLVDQLADARLLGVWPEGATSAPPSAPRTHSRPDTTRRGPRRLRHPRRSRLMFILQTTYGM